MLGEELEEYDQQVGRDKYLGDMALGTRQISNRKNGGGHLGGAYPDYSLWCALVV